MIRQKSFESDVSTLYLVPTPIGNLQEMTPRALDILKEVSVIAAEDTRNTKKLLMAFTYLGGVHQLWLCVFTFRPAVILFPPIFYS